MIELLMKNPIVIVIFLLGLISSFFYKQIRGFMGEFWVKWELKKLPKEYITLNNIMLSSNRGTHQIDHIVISKYGIFVIEMKNYYGLIVGNEYKDNWIQYLGKHKRYFENPIHQNYGHIKALVENLEMEENKFISVICISNQAKLNVKAKNTVQLDHLNSFILSFKKQILSQNLLEIKAFLEQKNIVDSNTRKAHVKNIQNRLKDNEIKKSSMICPKCGGNLVERNGKYGKFIGCSRYPKCKYTTKKILEEK